MKFLVVLILGFSFYFVLILADKIGLKRFSEKFREEPFTSIVAVANVILIMIAFLGFAFSYISNERSEKLFVSKNIPLITVQPIGVIQHGGALVIPVTVTNYSGFWAYNILVDICFQEGKITDTIAEWARARRDKIQKGDKKGVVEDYLYPSLPEGKDFVIEKLAPGKDETREIDSHQENIHQGTRLLQGIIKLKNICDSKNRSQPIQIRVVWKNLNGASFQEIYKYQLLCTKDSQSYIDEHGKEKYYDGDGRAFTFIYKGKLTAF